VDPDDVGAKDPELGESGLVDARSTPPSSLGGRLIESEVKPGVRYLLERHVGEGGMGLAYLARCEGPEGVSAVVVKLVIPAGGGEDICPHLVAQKEAVALGRLNEHVPPCPFVVRFVDTGTTRLFGGKLTPWLALEYVHGGVEGTTLEDRVTYSIHKTGSAFDPLRAAHALRCLAAGISAIHGVGVIHRDLTPGNVLCCGFGETEIFKISDFGLARPEGLGRTFTGVAFGTIGYAPPEQAMGGESAVGRETDVFALGCVTYYLLTGAHLFDASTALEAYELVKNPNRPSIAASPALTPELAERPDARAAIDAAIARATALEPRARFGSAEDLAQAILPWLGERPLPPRSSRRRLRSLVSLAPPSDVSSLSWVVKQRPRDDVVILSAAWDTDGHCFAFTPDGPRFYNGQSWIGAKRVLADLPRGMCFTRRYEAGGWLVGGSNGVLANFDTHGVREILRAPEPRLEFLDGSGRFDDLLVATSRSPGQPPALWASFARNWLPPLRLDGVRNVASLLRLDESRWLVCGRLVAGSSFAAVYEPRLGRCSPLATPPIRALVGGSSSPERGLALLVGSEGTALRVEAEQPQISVVGGGPDLSASAMDILGREWVGSLGSLWTRDPRLGEPWRRAWTDPSWRAPFVSMIADAGWIVAMTADAGIVEGRASGPAR
jgi:serine/threonine protein kinase